MITENIEDAIMVYHNIISHEFCEKVSTYIDKMCVKPLTAFDTDIEYRKVAGHTLTKNTISERIYFKKIYDEIWNFYPNYNFRFPQVKCSKLEQIDLLKYEDGGGYFYHCDNHGVLSPRTLSTIINLNEEYEGGDLVFGHQYLNSEMKRISLKKGSVAVFPSNFLFPHKIEPITKGKRYSIVSWLL